MTGKIGGGVGTMRDRPGTGECFGIEAGDMKRAGTGIWNNNTKCE